MVYISKSSYRGFSIEISSVRPGSVLVKRGASECFTAFTFGDARQLIDGMTENKES